MPTNAARRRLVERRPSHFDMGGKAAILTRSCPLWVTSGHSRRFGDVRYSLKSGHRSVGLLEVGCSFNQLVGAGEQRWWNCQSERLGGLEVDREVILCRCLHGKIGRLLAFEDAI